MYGFLLSIFILSCWLILFRVKCFKSGIYCVKNLIDARILVRMERRGEKECEERFKKGIYFRWLYFCSLTIMIFLPHALLNLILLGLCKDIVITQHLHYRQANPVLVILNCSLAFNLLHFKLAWFLNLPKKQDFWIFALIINFSISFSSSFQKISSQSLLECACNVWITFYYSLMFCDMCSMD